MFGVVSDCYCVKVMYLYTILDAAFKFGHNDINTVPTYYARIKHGFIFKYSGLKTRSFLIKLLNGYTNSFVSFFDFDFFYRLRLRFVNGQLNVLEYNGRVQSPFFNRSENVTRRSAFGIL